MMGNRHPPTSSGEHCPLALLGTARVGNGSDEWERYNNEMMTRLRARLRRLQWKLTWSYTWVAALSFLIVETMLLVLLMSVLGFNPLRRDIEVYNEIVAPILTDDIRPIILAHLRSQPVNAIALQADLEQILGLSLFETSFSVRDRAVCFCFCAGRSTKPVGFNSPICNSAAGWLIL